VAVRPGGGGVTTRLTVIEHTDANANTGDAPLWEATEQFVVGFDYSPLPTNVVNDLRAAVAAIQGVACKHLRETGNHLLAVKDLLPHGQFTAWAKVELGMSIRSVQRYMAAAEFFAGKSDNLSYLPADIIYRLSSRSAPVDVVAAIVAAAAAERLPPLEEIRQRLAAVKQTKRKTHLPKTDRSAAEDYASFLFELVSPGDRPKVMAWHEETETVDVVAALRRMIKSPKTTVH